MKGRTTTFIFIGIMLAAGIFGGISFAETINKPSFEDRQECMEKEHERRSEIMAEVLDLNESQQDKIRSIHEEERADMKEIMQQIREGHEQMRALLKADSFNEDAVRTLAKAQESLRTEMFVSRAKAKHEVFQLLTSEQQELAKKPKPLMHKQGKKKPPMHGI